MSELGLNVTGLGQIYEGFKQNIILKNPFPK